MGHGAIARPPLALTVSGAPTGTAIPSGFLGLSLEYPALRAYAGKDPHAINPVFEQLIRNLTPGQAPNLRIGGDTSDWTWWPVPGVRKPPGSGTRSRATGCRWRPRSRIRSAPA